MESNGSVGNNDMAPAKNGKKFGAVFENVEESQRAQNGKPLLDILGLKMCGF